MAGKLLVIGCRLPNGITLENPLKPGDKVTLRGLNSSALLGPNGTQILPEYVTTEVDSDFWDAWKTIYKDFQPLKTGAIFAASGERDAADKAKDYAKERTGFERLREDEFGVKKADKE